MEQLFLVDGAIVFGQWSNSVVQIFSNR